MSLFGAQREKQVPLFVLVCLIKPLNPMNLTPEPLNQRIELMIQPSI
jgi:hypothetical protein